MKLKPNTQMNSPFKNVRVIIFALFIFLAMASSSWATDYYVDTKNGSDKNNGTTSPWQTIGKANATLEPGDTVYIKAGTYYETIQPVNSGIKGSYITYARDPEAPLNSVIITGVRNGAYLRARNYIVIDGIRFEKPTNNCVEMWNSSGPYGNIIIKNCYMNGADGYSNIGMNWVDYCQILDNTFRSYCNASSPCDNCGGPDGDHITVYDSSHNLFQGNDFGNVPHSVLKFMDTGRMGTSYNIIKDNSFSNAWHHNIDIYGGDSESLHHYMIDNNQIYDAGSDHTNNWCGSDKDRLMADYDHNAIQLNSHSSIVRYNFFNNNGGIGLAGRDNYVYNNTLYQNVRIKQHSSSAIYNYIYKNNISYNNTYEVYRWITETPRNNYYINNNFLGGSFRYSPEESSDTSLSLLQSKYPIYWYDNLAKDPMFNDAANKDFTLISDSPMIDAGAWLTTITSNSGSGSSFVVNDAKYFMDGWGIIEGDKIQWQGQNQTRNIVKIEGNTITVNQSISWNKGNGVSLAFSGLRPDIGAYEDGSSGEILKLTIPPDQRVLQAN